MSTVSQSAPVAYEQPASESTLGLDDDIPAMREQVMTRTGSMAAIPRQPVTLAWFQRLVAGIVIGDVAAIGISLLVASLVRFGSAASWMPGPTFGYAVAASCVVIVWLAALSGAKSRAKRIIGEGLTEYQRVTNATLIAFGIVAIFCYLGQIEFARGYVAIALPLGWILLVINRFAWRRVLSRMRRRGRCLTGAIVVGSPQDVDSAVRQLALNKSAGYRPIAIALTSALISAPQEIQDRLSSVPRVSFDEVVEATKGSRARALMIAGDLPGGREQIRELGWSLENSRTEMILVSRLTDVAGPRIHLRPVAGLPMVHVQLPQYSGFAHGVKRVFDVFATTIGLILLSPILAIIALLVRGADGGPAIFRQERVGRGGTTFTMYKFRSMVIDAEARRSELANEGNGVLFKVRSDPRVTRIGAVLRRFSLDELPQLWNVFRGEMSLVGPRPPLSSEVEAYDGHETRRLISKPGLTGLWQVSGRSDLSWAESVRLDLYYVENWSFTGDLMLILRTVVQMFKHDGAY